MSSSVSRREFIKQGALAAGAGFSLPLLSSCAGLGSGESLPPLAPGGRYAAGPYQPNWDSLAAQYQCPEWFRDAKFGIWAHWSAQCVPEQGDWYARQMYIQGHPQYAHHLANYGHPSKFGFMEIDNLWKAERWEPEKLMALYRRAGAKYFFALANHHDNFDNYNSRHHAWNSVNVGPKRDLVGIWAQTARAAGLRFGVTNHSAHSWHWFQTAYAYDPEGPQAGVRYDGFTLTKEDGRGKWWEGLDPQELYNGRNIVMPDGLRTIAAANAWHAANDRVWNEDPPAQNPAFTERWFLRCRDLIDQYHPDVLYFDNTGLPLGQAGLDIAAHYYNSSIARTGRVEVVLNSKKLPPERRAGLVEDIERGIATEIRPAPWQTDTCIGNWHYERRLFDEHRYKTVHQVVHMLLDIVSKNGNLMLNIPVRGDGTIDADERKFLDGLGDWMAINGEGIFGSRPWKVYGDGPSVTDAVEAGRFGGAADVRSRPYTAEDVRFTIKGDFLYAYFLGWPAGGQLSIKALAARSGDRPALLDREIAGVRLLGSTARITWTRDTTALRVTLPDTAPGADAFALKLALQ
jgi:alpha-L-fucosidase